MPTANEIVRRNKEAEAEKAKSEFEKKPRHVLVRWVTELESKLQELIDCNGCKRRREKIKKKLASLKAFLKIEE